LGGEASELAEEKIGELFSLITARGLELDFEFFTE